MGMAERELTALDRVRVCAELAFRYMKARVSGDAAVLAEVQGGLKKALAIRSGQRRLRSIYSCLVSMVAATPSHTDVQGTLG
jgi:hypothetical protein